MAADDFTIGVEEEFQLVDVRTGALQPGVEDVLPAAQRRTRDGEVSHELQQTQIEIGTPICRTLDEVRSELVRLRGRVGEAAADRGLTIVAAGSHPSATMSDERFTRHDDYLNLAEQYGQLAREQTVFGCHVHVGVADRDLAVAAMNHLRPWLPVLLALSSSSPFWCGVDTGYSSYRSEVFGRWPTAGPAEIFRSRAEFDDVVEQLLASEAIDDRARIYWDVRPSAKYETLELRVADVCTSLDDAVMIAGLAGALVRQGCRDADAGLPPPDVRPELLRAARWRAARHGLDADLIDVIGRRSVRAADAVGQLLDHLRPTLLEWGELDEVERLVNQATGRGTSARRQRDAFATRSSLDDVVRWLIEETAAH